MGKHIQIAIDGPVGAGKSTVAKVLSQKLGITYVYTGAMYRAVAYYAREKGIDWRDEDKISSIVSEVDIDIKNPSNGSEHIVYVYISGEDVSDEVFTSEISEGASIISQYPEVRRVLVEKQRMLANNRSVVMDGRDIGTNVLPDANLKIYLDADVDERIDRKKEQLNISYEKAKKDVLVRDSREMGREHNPLKPAPGAWVFDTTDLSIDEVVGRIMERVAKL